MKNIIKEKEIIIDELKKNNEKEKENNQNIKNTFNSNELICEQLEIISYYTDIKKQIDNNDNNIIIKSFKFNDLVFEKLKGFSYIIKTE